MTEIQCFEGDGEHRMQRFVVECHAYDLAPKESMTLWWFGMDPAERNVYARALQYVVGYTITVEARPSNEDQQAQIVEINVKAVDLAHRQCIGHDHWYGVVIQAIDHWAIMR